LLALEQEPEQQALAQQVLVRQVLGQPAVV